MSTPESDSTSSEAAILARKIELLELQQKKHDLEAATKSPPSKPWWVSAIEFLGLPAVILAIVIQLTQASSNVQTTAKVEAETAKLKVEEVKTRVELQKMLDDLADTKKKGVAAYREEVERTIPQLQQTIERLRLIESQSGAALLERSLAKYVLLWVLFHFVGLIFDVIYQVWSTLLSGTSTFLSNLQFKDKDGREDYKRRQRLLKYIQWGHLVLGPVPTVLRWSLQLSIFFALMIPLFNEVAIALGAKTPFEVVMAQAKNLEISAALSTMKQVLFGVSQ
jgi:hypothetical protein